MLVRNPAATAKSDDVGAVVRIELGARSDTDLYAEPRPVVFDAGHYSFPRSEMIRETLAWLDKYLGPVGASRSTAQ